MSVEGLSGDVLVGAAGFVAGAINAIAGGGTLVSFPALLAVGNSALTANITSSVGLLAGYAGGSVAYRPELRGQRHRVARLGVAAVTGGLGGALLLLLTPSGVFRDVVPYLVLFACALLAGQPRLARWVAGRRRVGRAESDAVPALAVVAVLAGAVYGSYFGAALGVVLLAVFGIVIDEGLQRLNALKGLLSLLISAAGVAVFLAVGHVAWMDALILTVTAWAGATVGVRLARRLSPALLRAAVIVMGVVVAAALIATG